MGKYPEMYRVPVPCAGGEECRVHEECPGPCEGGGRVYSRVETYGYPCPICDGSGFVVYTRDVSPLVFGEDD